MGPKNGIPSSKCIMEDVDCVINDGLLRILQCKGTAVEGLGIRIGRRRNLDHRKKKRVENDQSATTPIQSGFILILNILLNYKKDHFEMNERLTNYFKLISLNNILFAS